MSDCVYRSRLGAFHDGELDAALRRQIESHLPACPACQSELEQVRLLSTCFDDLRSERLTDSEWSRAHAAIERTARDEGRILRIAGTLTGLAASVLIIGAAWMHELPGGTGPPRRPVVVISPQAAPAWERVAMTLQTDPLPPGPWPARDDQALADARLADWMVQQLRK